MSVAQQSLQVNNLGLLRLLPLPSRLYNDMPSSSTALSQSAARKAWEGELGAVPLLPRRLLQCAITFASSLRLGTGTTSAAERFALREWVQAAQQQCARMLREEREEQKQRIGVAAALTPGTASVVTRSIGTRYAGRCFHCGATCAAGAAHAHLLFRGLAFCARCDDSYRNGTWEFDDDGTDRMCRICGDGGSLYLCGRCPRAFCERCILLLFGESGLSVLHGAGAGWRCLLCPSTSPGYAAIRHPDWQRRLQDLLESCSQFPDEEAARDAQLYQRLARFVVQNRPHFPARRATKRPLVVLSLFDGIAGALVVLRKLGIAVQRYYTSEINAASQTIARANHPDVQIVPLGDVRSLSDARVAALGHIDLVIGGSPCQDFSLANRSRNLPRGDGRQIYGTAVPAQPGARELHACDLCGLSGQLLFDFVRVLAAVRRLNPDVFYLFENVPMRQQVRARVGRFFEVSALPLNASEFSAAHRPRLYWLNIAPDTDPSTGLYKRVGVTLQDVLERPAVATRRKAFCVRSSTGFIPTGQLAASFDAPGITAVRTRAGSKYVRGLRLREVERCMGFPDGYVSAKLRLLGLRDDGKGRVAASRAAWALLGDSFSVQTVARLLAPLRQSFSPAIPQHAGSYGSAVPFAGEETAGVGASSATPPL